MERKRIAVICSWILAVSLLLPYVVKGETEAAEETFVEAPGAVLMEAETGKVIFEKDMETKRSPASITKIMTLLLIFDEIKKGSLKLTDMISTSAYAKSMGGSQVFLEEGETQTAETMIKCIVIASGNDASVAMAEHIAGSEQDFVKRMNVRAKELGMKNTNFEDCCGLTDSDNHYTTAYDIAVMSRELVTKYPEILSYSSVWMEDITHETKKSSSTFTLTNTNKLIRSYEGCKGLKTGSTSKAGYCLSAVAERNGVTLIAVVMAAPDYKARFKDAAAMLTYGFSKCNIYIDEKPSKLPEIKVKGGIQKSVSLKYKEKFKYLNTEGEALEKIEKKLTVPRETEAPVKKGEKAGEMNYYMGKKKLGCVPVLYKESVRKIKYEDWVKRVWEAYLF